ncbi:uncharacterized protein LOC134275253 [Saccostrea cucullata]|uniref:uncharacterized protein LOC134275253 n=1 Tax=Saccostrea cuccullata TaxID=36930 RepID=UPI002ED0C00F
MIDMLHCLGFVFLLCNCFARAINGGNEPERIADSWACKEEMSHMAPICHCDVDCVTYRDCCDNVADFTDTTLSLKPKQECRRFGSRSFPSFWAVTSCPGEGAVKKRGIFLPVVTEGGTVFVDDDIAKCNNISSFLPMDIHVILDDLCDVDLIISSLEARFMNLVMSIGKSNCRFIFSPPSDSRAFPRLCLDLREEQTMKIFSSECYNNLRPEKISSVLYRNTRCFEDIHGYPMPENVTDIADIYKQPSEIGTSLHIRFIDNSSNLNPKHSICPYKFRNFCHTRLIKNWNQTVEIEVDSFHPISDYHIKYSTVYFVYNFLQNNVNLTAERATVDLIKWKNSQCQTLVIRIFLRSTRDLSREDLSRVMNFINLFKLSSFSSSIKTVANNSSSKIRSYMCANPLERREILKRKRVHSFSMMYVLRIMEYLSNSMDIDIYCQNLVVESKERLNRKFVDVYLMKWECVNNPTTDTISLGEYDPQSVYITITVLAVSGIVIFVLYFTSLKDANVLDRS